MDLCTPSSPRLPLPFPLYQLSLSVTSHLQHPPHILTHIRACAWLYGHHFHCFNDAAAEKHNSKSASSSSRPGMSRVALAALLSLAAALLSRHVYRRVNRHRLQAGAVALITGGGSGLGMELAKIFAVSHCEIVLVGRNEEALKTAAQVCREAGAPRVEYIQADISKAEGTDRVRSEYTRLYKGTGRSLAPPLKYLVLNAGAGAIAPFTTEPAFEQICRDMMNINYFANVRLLQAFLPQLTQNHSSSSPSRIVVMSSLAGVLPSILRSAYTASKHAIQGFMNALRGETAVRITLCCPGYVDTDFHSRVLTNDGKPLGGNQRRGVSPAVCAHQCMDGVLCDDAEIVMTTSGKLAYRLRPFLTGIIDVLVKRKSLQSLEHH
ncbi:short chain dehydrogenase-like protein [Leishmania mexicana MHOM/GT/2001/U1103]|uniref:Short chain dehydrogenase-like protein n=1 Tax=Leishmania mexicana (strain MHOM/GT/2001/U1103) TaxID=929439 RepID=E9ATC0_LEIMU|nr:short chain dehydrogenase-like protein [Leishmania mexicana MHOM/GT/2001/U1103]CBZ26194.1 short chain dehydrogenase-like protein [Leishmania mexicana MHOM/GT/2001/U1103]